ncbi:MAG TPA: CHASE3 domain-containing protein, partial [Actinomycetales bacterium]
MSTWRLRDVLLLISAVVVVAVAATGIALLRLSDESRSARQRQADLVAASDAQGRLVARFVDQETALRGYLLGGDPTFLDPYSEAVRVLPQLTGTLRTATADDPQLRAATDQLLGAHQAWQSQILDAELATIRRGELDVARARESGGAGKVLFDSVRRRADTLSGLLRSRSQQEAAAVAELDGQQRRLLEGTLAGLM